jgi:excisionase family DNA binding protein
MSTPAGATGLKVAELQLYTIEEAMTMLRMGRTTIFDQLRNGRLRSVREGRARRIPAKAIAEYIALLEREEAERNAA